MIFKEVVHENDELAHAGCQGDQWFFTSGPQAGIEFFKNAVVTDGAQRGHVKRTPHGSADLFHRGTRMSSTATGRILPCLCSIALLAVACLLYFGPNFMTGEPPWEVLALKIGWLGIVAVALLTPLQVFNEYVVITDDGLLKSNLFGRQTRMAWNDIVTFRINPDDNKVIFLNKDNRKLTMSLAYDGWQDFLEMAARHMNQPLYHQFQFMFTSIDIKPRPIIRKN